MATNSTPSDGTTSEPARPPRFPLAIYTEEEQETWRLLLERYQAMMPDHMAQDYLEAFARMNYDPHRIPLLADVEEKLRLYSDWRLERVNGIVQDAEFYSLFAHKMFPCNDFIRKRTEIDYTPSPDIFHEVIGHVPMLTNPFFADFSYRLGLIAIEVLKKFGPEKLTPFARIYWFTIEFGLVETAQGVRIFGAGFGPGEMRRALTSVVEHRPFIIEEVARTAFNYWEMQPTLFVVKSLDDMAQQFEHWAAAFDPNTVY